MVSVQTWEWLRLAEERETLLSLELLCILGAPAPELDELLLCLRHIHNLLRAYRLRLMAPEWREPWEEAAE